jgi:hypothetical protein
MRPRSPRQELIARDWIARVPHDSNPRSRFLKEGVMKMRCFLAPIVLAALSTALQAQND